MRQLNRHKATESALKLDLPEGAVKFKDVYSVELKSTLAALPLPKTLTLSLLQPHYLYARALAE